MERAYYHSKIAVFCQQTPDEILGEIVRRNPFALQQKQRNAWIYEIKKLQEVLAVFRNGYVALEYTVPRIGSRIDCVFYFNGIIYLLEFKVGNKDYPADAVEQVVDYALDLKYFHKESHDRRIVPLLVCTHAPEEHSSIAEDEDGVFKPILCNEKNLAFWLNRLTGELGDDSIDFGDWINSPYMPTPTIIEAAQALYRGHNVQEISRSDAGAYNLSLTTEAIDKIIDKAKILNQKVICFVTGVPGAGKTLAGLNIAVARHRFAENEHAVFLSGNGPLVKVLREALARDENRRSRGTVRLEEARRKAEAFIQNIHHFRDDMLRTQEAPVEKVVIFDEAQRAWTKNQTTRFLAERGIHDFEMSEPEFLISIMNRHQDWAVIICLVGGGQEINTGEAGLMEWFDAIRNRFPTWKVYVSPQIGDDEYTRGEELNKVLKGLNVEFENRLHLAVSVRSFRSEQVSAFVKALLDVDIDRARTLYAGLKGKYPIMLTRDLDKAKAWIRHRARGSERYGLIASSGAKRLRRYGIWVQHKVQPETWFLNPKEDVRSSYFLEETATEFDIQGLELDWTIVAWDADFRMVEEEFKHYSFSGTTWKSINSEHDRLYLKNAYRVLLTRARQGFIIFIPTGDENDKTHSPDLYDGTYRYLREIGIEEI